MIKLIKLKRNEIDPKYIGLVVFFFVFLYSQNSFGC